MKTSGVLTCLAAGACVLAACGTTSTPPKTASGAHTTTTHRAATTTTTVPLARGQQDQRDQVPWNQVGAGWALAEWTATTPTAAEQPPTTTPGESNSLFLVNPQGGRYLVGSVPTSSQLELTAWSGDGMRALLVGAPGSGSNGSTPVTELNLETGSQHSFTISSSVSVGYSNPSGLALLTTTQESPTLKRLSTTGGPELTYPTTFAGLGAFNGSSDSSPDGTEIAMGTQGGGVALVGNNGSVINNLPVPGTSYCSPERWWTDDELLVSCMPSGQGVPLLWLVPTAGGSPNSLTVTPPSGNADNGDEVAWQVGSSVYLQDAGGCGYQYLAELNANHTTTPVTVPGVVQGDSQLVLGTVGEQIGLYTTIGCGPGLSLLWYDPQTSQTNVVLGPGLNAGSVTGAILFGDNNGSLR
jgi:hypothetical protein